MRLSRQVVNLLGVDFFEQTAQGTAVGQVAVMQIEMDAALMGVDVDGVQSLGVERRSTADHSVYFVPFRQQ